MSTASDRHRGRQEGWDERHRLGAKEQREREGREGTDLRKAARPKTQSFFDWPESERATEAALRAEELRQAAEEVRRGREEMNRPLEDRAARMGGPGSVPPCPATPGPGRDADLEQVKAGHRRLALVHHPDKGGEAGEFQRIKRAHGPALVVRRRSRGGRS